MFSLTLSSDVQLVIVQFVWMCLSSNDYCFDCDIRLITVEVVAVVHIVAVRVVQLEMGCLKQCRIIEYKTLKGEDNGHFFRESVWVN